MNNARDSDFPSIASFIYDANFPDGRLVDTEKNIVFRQRLFSCDGVWFQWFSLDWHGKTIRLYADLWRMTPVESVNGLSRFDIEWKILAVRVPNAFPEKKEHILEVIKNALQAFGYLYDREIARTMKVTLAESLMLAGASDVFERPPLRAEKIDCGNDPEYTPPIDMRPSGFIKVVGYFGGGRKMAVDHQQRIWLRQEKPPERESSIALFSLCWKNSVIMMDINETHSSSQTSADNQHSKDYDWHIVAVKTPALFTADKHETIKIITDAFHAFANDETIGVRNLVISMSDDAFVKPLQLREPFDPAEN